MTENEAVMILENLRPGCGEKLVFSEGEICEAIDTAISTLEEIHNYRKFGTLEELARANTYIKLAKLHGSVGEMIDRCAAYERIGSSPERITDLLIKGITTKRRLMHYQEIATVEECREAIEKQKMKKSIDYDGDLGYFVCPSCGCTIMADEFSDHKYCLNCGQSLLW